jgi:hypothetical protein
MLLEPSLFIIDPLCGPFSILNALSVRLEDIFELWLEAIVIVVLGYITHLELFGQAKMVPVVHTYRIIAIYMA